VGYGPFCCQGVVDFQCFYGLLSPWLSWVILSSLMKKVCKEIMAAGKITKKQLSALKISKLALPRWPTQAQTAKLSSRAAYCFSLRDFSKGQGKSRRNHDWI
jgi:membrane peptidoglycan carboxypeptidase